MNEKIDLVEHEVEGLDFVDLGDASEETKQIAPSTIAPDFVYGWGWSSR